MWVFVMALVGYGSNDKRLRVWEKVDWMDANIFIRDYYLQYTNFMSLSDKESMIVNPVITAHTSRKKEEIKILTRLHSSFVLWRSLNWIKGWGRENIFCVDFWDGCTEK